MKILVHAAALAVIGSGVAVVPALTSGAAAAPDPRPLVERMRDDADGSVAVSDERATGKLSFVRTTAAGDLLPGQPGVSAAQAAAKARTYLDQYAEAFGAPADQLVDEQVQAGRFGTHVVTYSQEVDGVPVFGSMVKAHLDGAGDLTAVNGELVPVGDVGTTADLSASEAAGRAVRLVRAAPPTDEAGRVDVRGIEASAPELVLYRTGLTKGVAGGETVLAYSVEVSNGTNVRDMVFLDADNGKVVNRYTMLDSASPDRELYEADSNRDLTLVWEEGDPFPGGLNPDQQNLVLSAGESFWLFENAFGRDSYDGEGATMRTVNNDPAIRCPNANWNGVTTNYCDGVTSDDVVAHEWTHAYTEYTHGLIYQWQPGALNEAYSDIVGETLDLVNGREDEGEGAIDEPRPDGLCSTQSPAQPLLTINSPSAIAKDCATAGASFGKQLDATGITGDVVAPTDAVEAGGGTATDGCSPYEQDVTGKVVLVDRGFCLFSDKAQVATDAGAKALVIGNREDAPLSMSGDDPTLVTTVSIGLGDRELIRSALADGQRVNVTMRDAAGQRSNSFRWLVGEKSTAFGGAIRDMWNPTCYGDPGKVSDAEYKCSTDDSGGVHSNSGVANHGYALLVDGGTSNGVTVRGIGIDKALNIYYTAMTEYQTPASDFVDHANSLEASCADLTGKAIREISTAADDSVVSTDKITTRDCAQVAKMADAVELRLDPAEQCEFQPLLQPGAPSACGAGFVDEQVFGEDFEITDTNTTGLDRWFLRGVNPYGGPTFPWTTTRDYDGDHTSRVAYGPDPDAGDCSGTETDATSVDFMSSRPIDIPAEGAGLRLSFDHYVATETGFDGGNVQVSVNDGPFRPLEASSYVFNPPGQLSTEAEGSTNPLAGQPGFTGTDGGEVDGSWGTSIVDLEAAGVAAGDTIRMRFAMGRDGCSGIDGWYVDNVSVDVCLEAGPPQATFTNLRGTIPDPVRTGRPFAARVLVTADDAQPTGQVELLLGDRVIGTDTLNRRGVALIESERVFAKPGPRRLVAHYLGAEGFRPSRDGDRIRVVRTR